MSSRGALPVSRINTIMRSSSDAENIAKESPVMMVKATELFIKFMAKEAFEMSDGKKLDYNHLAEIVNRDDRYEFLRDIMPKKITFAEYKKLQDVKSNEAEDTSCSGSSSGSSSSSSEENSSVSEEDSRDSQ